MEILRGGYIPFLHDEFYQPVVLSVWRAGLCTHA